MTYATQSHKSISGTLPIFIRRAVGTLSGIGAVPASFLMKRLLLPLLALVLAACSFFPESVPTPLPPDLLETAVALTVAALSSVTLPPLPSSTPAPFPTSSPAPLPSSTPALTATPNETGPVPPPPRPEEALLILMPGPGSKLTSPIEVSGVSDPTQHQQVLIELVAEDGSIIARRSATISADLGQRGPFSVDLPFAASAQNARIQASFASPRDGGLLHLSSVTVQLLASGAPDIVPAQPHPEDIYISSPRPGAVVSGGSIEVRGVALASFEQNLIVEIWDEDGTMISQIAAIVQAPDLGQPGPFSVTVPYGIAGEQPGRIVVKDESVGIPGLIHLASVEVTLRP